MICTAGELRLACTQRIALKGLSIWDRKGGLGSLSLQRDSYSLQRACECRCWSDNKITKNHDSENSDSFSESTWYLRYSYHIPLIQCIYSTLLSSSPHAIPSQLAVFSLFLFRFSFGCLSPHSLFLRL